MIGENRQALPALIPAAGRSRRMGRPKLILPLADGRSVIESVIRALRGGGANPIFLVVPPADEPGSAELARIGGEAGAVVIVCPEATSDMKETVLVGLSYLESSAPGILLVPGDSPGITAEVVDRVRWAFLEDPATVVIPTHDGKRGHPVALPRSLCGRIAALPPDRGINVLIRDPASVVRELPIPEPGISEDLDTPDDYRRWLAGRGF
ncbi:MAG: nucleotidyltransferase family protein [Isosphaeraceae bacterium]